MRAVILSLKPNWADLIRSGEKTIELRRRFPARLMGERAYVYESSPVCGLTGVLQIGKVHCLPLAELWVQHGKASRIDNAHFDAYFAGLDAGYALEINQCRPFKKVLELSDLRKRFGFTAPQSWAYVSDRLNLEIEELL